MFELAGRRARAGDQTLGPTPGVGRQGEKVG
jgi:hypothetical protein